MQTNSPIFAITDQLVNDHKMTFDPTSAEVTCMTIPKDHKNPSRYVDTATIFPKGKRNK